MALQVFGKTFKVVKGTLEQAAKESFLYLGRDFEANLKFVGEAEIIKLNKQYRGQEKPTDVLSFVDDVVGFGGDIVICYKVSQEEAKNTGVDVTDMSCILLVHGILHLAGYDHLEASERDKMESAEKEILEKVGVVINQEPYTGSSQR